MDIRKLYKHKDLFEDKITNINYEVKKRWELLIGFGCDYMNDWNLNNDMVNVSYEYKGDLGTDEIPVRFFEIEDDKLAKEGYKAYLEKKELSKNQEKEREKQIKEMELYKKLHEKYGDD